MGPAATRRERCPRPVEGDLVEAAAGRWRWLTWCGCTRPFEGDLVEAQPSRTARAGGQLAQLRLVEVFELRGDGLQWEREDAQALMERGQAPLAFNKTKP